MTWKEGVTGKEVVDWEGSCRLGRSKVTGRRRLTGRKGVNILKSYFYLLHFNWHVMRCTILIQRLREYMNKNF